MAKHKVLTLDNKGQKYIKEGLIEQVIKTGLEQKPNKKGSIPIFDKGWFGCGGTHSILTQTKQPVILLTPAAAAVKDKERQVGPGKYDDVGFIYGESKDKTISREIKKYYGTPEMFLLKWRDIKSIFGEDILVMLDEFHEWHEVKSYRHSMQKIDRLGCKLLGMTATVPPIFKKDVVVKLKNVWKPKLKLKSKYIQYKEEGIVKKHADTGLRQVFKCLQKNIKKKPHLVSPDLKQVTRLMGYAKQNDLKVKLYVGRNADYWTKQFEDQTFISQEGEDYDFSLGTVSGTNGIDLHTGDEFITIINSISKGTRNAGLTEEQCLQCIGRGRDAKLVKAFLFTDRKSDYFDRENFAKAKKESKEKNSVTYKARKKSANILYNKHQDYLTPTYGIYEIGEDKQSIKYLESKTDNYPSSSKVWKEDRKFEIDYFGHIEYEVGNPTMLSFFADSKFNEYNRSVLRDCYDRSLFKLFDGADKKLADYYGIIQSVVYDALYDSAGNLSINLSEEQTVDSLFGPIKYSYNKVTNKVTILSFPDFHEKLQSIKDRFWEARKPVLRKFNNWLAQWDLTYMSLVKISAKNKVFQKEGTEDLFKIYKAARYTKSQNKEYADAFNEVTENINGNERFEQFKTVNIEDFEERVLHILGEVCQWFHCKPSRNRAYGYITNTSKELREILLTEFFGDKYERFDIRACALSTIALMKFNLPIPKNKDYYAGEGDVRSENKVKVNTFLNYRHGSVIDPDWIDDVKKRMTQPEFIDEFVKYHYKKLKDCQKYKIKTAAYIDGYTMYEKQIIKQYKNYVINADNTALTLRLHDELIVVSRDIKKIKEKMYSMDASTQIEYNEHVREVNFLTLEAKHTWKGHKASLDLTENDAQNIFNESPIEEKTEVLLEAASKKQIIMSPIKDKAPKQDEVLVERNVDIYDQLTETEDKLTPKLKSSVGLAGDTPDELIQKCREQMNEYLQSDEWGDRKPPAFKCNRDYLKKRIDRLHYVDNPTEDLYWGKGAIDLMEAEKELKVWRTTQEVKWHEKYLKERKNKLEQELDPEPSFQGYIDLQKLREAAERSKQVVNFLN